MNKRTRMYVIGGSIIAALVCAYVVLFLEVAAPAQCAFRFDLAKARTLASAVEGEKPKEIRYERLTTYRDPHFATRAGAPWETIEMKVFSYQLAYPDRHIVLDSGMNEKNALDTDGTAYDADAWKRVLHGLETSAAVYVTHEHIDHLSGLLEGPASYKNAKLTPEQLAAGARLEPAVIPAEAKQLLQPLVYDEMTAVAPGLVLVKAPGHTPGSQWFFVTKADGTEVLFTGDTAWQGDNIEYVQGPPRVVSLFLHNDRDAHACQLAVLHALHESDPKIALVPGHDGGRIRELETAGVMLPRFQ